MLYDTCPDCGHDHIVATPEDNSVIYECQSCDWIAVATAPFCPGAWSVRIKQALAPIDILQSLLGNEDAVSFLKPRLKGGSYLANLPEWSVGTSTSDEYLRGEMDIAKDVYLRQMVVLAATYVQPIMTDFFRCVFVTQPCRMNQVLPPSDKKHASIPLAQLIKAGSKDELLADLANQAADIKGGGQADKILEELIRECNIKVGPTLVKDMKALKDLRNRIVHDDTEETIAFEEIHSMFGLILYLLYVLAQVADKYGVACWDDIGFLRDFQEKFQAVKP